MRRRARWRGSAPTRRARRWRASTRRRRSSARAWCGSSVAWRRRGAIGSWRRSSWRASPTTTTRPRATPRSRSASSASCVPAADVERALVARWDAASPSLRRALAEALGKLGGADALALLDGARAPATATTPSWRASRTKRASRSSARSAASTPGAIADDVAPPAPLRAARPLPPRPGASCSPTSWRRTPPRVVDDETVVADAARAARRRCGARAPCCASASRCAPRGADVERRRRRRARLRRGLGHPVALHPRHRPLSPRVGRRRPPPRAHLPRRRRGRRAPPAAGQRSDRDAVGSVVREKGQRATVELWPRGLPDPRFAYRVAHVPASSHPTLAAALARVAGARPDDVVWDPFVGAATELVERARLGPDARALRHRRRRRRPRPRARQPRRRRASPPSSRAPTRAPSRRPRRRRSSSPIRRWAGASSTAIAPATSTATSSPTRPRILPRGGAPRLDLAARRRDPRRRHAARAARHLPPARRHGRLLGRDPVVHEALSRRPGLSASTSRACACAPPSSPRGCDPPSTACAPPSSPAG